MSEGLTFEDIYNPSKYRRIVERVLLLYQIFPLILDLPVEVRVLICKLVKKDYHTMRINQTRSFIEEMNKLYFIPSFRVA